MPKLGKITYPAARHTHGNELSDMEALSGSSLEDGRTALRQEHYPGSNRPPVQAGGMRRVLGPGAPGGPRGWDGEGGGRGDRGGEHV